MTLVKTVLIFSRIWECVPRISRAGEDTPYHTTAGQLPVHVTPMILLQSTRV